MYFAMTLMLKAGPGFHPLGQLLPSDDLFRSGCFFVYTSQLTITQDLVSRSNVILLCFSLCDESVVACIFSNQAEQFFFPKMFLVYFILFFFIYFLLVGG